MLKRPAAAHIYNARSALCKEKKMRNFLLLVFSPSSVLIAYDLIFYFRPISSECGRLCPETVGIILYTDIISIISTALCLLIFSQLRLKVRKPNNSKELSLKWYWLIFLLVILLYFFLVYSVFATLDISEAFANYDTFYSLSGTGTAWVFLIFYSLLFVMLYDMYRANLNSTKVSIYLLTLTIVALTGGRSIIAILLLFLVFIGVVVHHIKIKATHYMCGVFAVLLIFFGNGLMRAGGSDTYIDTSSRLDFNAAFILDDVVTHVDENGPSWLVSAQDFYYFFVPRSLVEDKPISTAETRLVYPEVAERGTNYTLGLYANLLLNLGYFGFIVIPFVILAVNFTYFYFSLYARRSAIAFFCLFLSFYSIQLVRGGVINSRYLMFLVSISAAIIMWNILVRARGLPISLKR